MATAKNISQGSTRLDQDITGAINPITPEYGRYEDNVGVNKLALLQT